MRELTASVRLAHPPVAVRDVLRPGGRLRDLGTPDDATRDVVIGARLDHPHPCSTTVIAASLPLLVLGNLDLKWRLSGRLVVDLERGVADAEAILEQALQLAPAVVAVVAGAHDDVSG